MARQISSPRRVCLTIPLTLLFLLSFPSLPFPLFVLSYFLFPLPILSSFPFPGPFLSALHVLLTLAVVIAIAIASMAISTAWYSGICPPLTIIILVEYLIPIQWINCQEVTWLLLQADWPLNLCTGMIATIPTEILADAFNLSRAGCLRIGEIDFIPEGTGVVWPRNVHFFTGFVNHLPHL